MSDLVKSVTEYRVKLQTKVTAMVYTHMRFTDADVREWAELDGNEEVDPDVLEEYALENLDEGSLELGDIEDWSPLGHETDLTIISAEKTMQAPPEFVPLPGMEGL